MSPLHQGPIQDQDLFPSQHLDCPKPNHSQDLVHALTQSISMHQMVQEAGTQVDSEALKFFKGAHLHLKCQKTIIKALIVVLWILTM